MGQAVHPPQFHPHPHPNQVKTASGLNFLVAIYLLISGWIGAVSTGPRINAIVFGIIAAILAIFRFGRTAPFWVSWANVLIGLWMILSPWVYRYTGEPWMWNSIIIGIVMVGLGLWSAIAGGMTRPVP